MKKLILALILAVSSVAPVAADDPQPACFDDGKYDDCPDLCTPHISMECTEFWDGFGMSWRICYPVISCE